ncbi:MAG: hypothetical protein CMM62_08560 [Rhodospirillaceae bacterium]|nr:hypothetical protein [Rhodospirillaceae bacterium]MAX61503.1 hypothetical protein [Rhodospirillaceae bacterium]MAX61981.1 hypothetical protein [Rhodospirillaceae bacterium]|tara:strand:- start:828 stop:2084 length:1257 start_codon:yes stop_codon:yes gene_type:complete
MSIRNFMDRPADPMIGPIIFFGIFAFGAAVIIFLKINGASQVVVTTVPIVIMVGYAVLMYAYRPLRLRLDQAGDNIYYLGFLFTLISLAWSLYTFNSDDANTGEIITNFGIAIATTIVGLAGRVFFAQMRQDPNETEQVARIELAEAARSLRLQLDNSAREMSSFGRSVQQMTTEGLEETKKAVDTFMENGMQRFESSATAFATSVETANSGFSARTQALENATTSLVNTMTDLSNRIGSVRVNDDFLESQLKPAAEQITNAAQQLSQAGTSLATEIKRINFPKDLIEDQFGSTISNLNVAADAMKAIATSEREGILKITESTDSLSRGSLQLREDVSELSKVVRNLGHSVSSLQKGIAAIEAFPNSLKEMASDLRAHSTEMQDASAKYVKAMNDTASRLEGSFTKRLFSRFSNRDEN